MATDAAATTGPAPVSRTRPRFPAILATVAVLAIVVVWLVPRPVFDPGVKRSATAVVIAIAVLLLWAWFVLFSRARWASRMIAVLVLVACVGGAFAAVRRVDFTGGMMPVFDWRWTTDRNVAVEQHRASAANKLHRDIGPIEIGPHDVLDYRGANRDGIVVGPALARSWEKAEPRAVWRQPVGGGYAAFVLAGPLAVTIEQRRDREAIVAYDVETGGEVWMHDYPTLFFEPAGGAGPRATPTIAGDRVYALGATGILTCLDLRTGKPYWSTNILTANHAGNLDWAMSGSPLVYDGLVVVNPGTQKGNSESKAILAFDAESGHVRFGAGTGQAGYASPMLTTLAGQRQILMFEAPALVGYDASSGEELWRHAWKSGYDINAAQPIILPDDLVFITSDAGSALLKITRDDKGFAVKRLWKNRNLKGQYACPIAYDGHVYGLDDEILVCLSLADGKRKWKAGRYGHGQMLLAGDLLVVLSEQGDLALVQATPEKFTELGKIRAIEGRTWNNPTLRDGRIFVRNHLEMAAYDLPLAPTSVNDP